MNNMYKEYIIFDLFLEKTLNKLFDWFIQQQFWYSIFIITLFIFVNSSTGSKVNLYFTASNFISELFELLFELKFKLDLSKSYPNLVLWLFAYPNWWLFVELKLRLLRIY